MNAARSGGVGVGGDWEGVEGGAYLPGGNGGIRMGVGVEGGAYLPGMRSGNQQGLQSMGGVVDRCQWR